MASVAGIRAGRAYVEIGADRTPLTRALRQSERDLKRFGLSYADLGKRMMGAGAAIAAPVSLSVKTFASFDDQMRIVQAVTGATAGEFAKLTEQAKELGRTTSFTAAQVAAGMVELGRAGFASNEISDAIGGVMDLARATATEVPTATQIASGALRAFGLSASDMARVCDVLTVAANGSAQNLGDMGEALKYVAPLASQAGMTLEDTSKIIGALANFSVKGSQAGTVFKNVLMQMADPAIQEKFRAIGVETVDMNGKLRNAADVLLDVGRATAKLPNAQRLDVFKGLFGKIGLAGGAALTKANFDDFYKSIDAAAGKAKDVAGQMDAGIGGSFRLLASAVEGSMIALGESLAPELESVSSKIQDVSARATAWIQDNKELIKSFMLLAKNLVVAGAELYVVGKGFQVLGSAVGIAGKVVNLTASFKNLGKTLGVLKAVVASSFGPFALLATVVGGAAVALGTKYVIAAKKADDAMRSSAEAVKKQVAAHQAAQAELQNSFRRLQELSEQQVLTDSEMEEAAKLVGELSDAYGDLGITLDTTARKLNIAADAQEKFNEAQRRQKLEDIRIQEDQLAKENQYIEKKLKGLTGAGGVARELGSYFKFNKNIQTRMDELYGRQNEIIRERSFLKEQRNLLTGKAPLSAAPTPAATTAAASTAETAAKAASTSETAAKAAFTNEMRASAEAFESRMGAAPTPAATTAAASTAETAARRPLLTRCARARRRSRVSELGWAPRIRLTLRSTSIKNPNLRTLSQII
jgi:TP901 family phage tail tape measure protein